MTVLPPADADNNSLHWLQKDDLHYLARWCPQKWWGRWWLMFHRSGFVWRASPLYLSKNGFRYHSPVPFPKDEPR